MSPFNPLREVSVKTDCFPSPKSCSPWETAGLGIGILVKTMADLSEVPHLHEMRANSPQGGSAIDTEKLTRQIADLGEWFHNLDLHGVQTAPHHFLGDFPNIKWQWISQAIPNDLTGARVLDIGCNGGFYSIQMKQRGAEYVLGIDIDDRYLEQAEFAAKTLGLQIDLRKLSVYDVDKIAGEFDYVIFMGVFYHLRYPLFALDKIIKKMRGKLIFQTMIRGSEEVKVWGKDYSFWTKDIFADPAFPAMYFIEHSYSHDYTNWWIPNRAAVEAMLRSSGLKIVQQPESETWICALQNTTRNGRYILDLELDGTL